MKFYKITAQKEAQITQKEAENILGAERFAKDKMLVKKLGGIFMDATVPHIIITFKS